MNQETLARAPRAWWVVILFIMCLSQGQGLALGVQIGVTPSAFDGWIEEFCKCIELGLWMKNSEADDHHQVRYERDQTLVNTAVYISVIQVVVVLTWLI